MKRVKDDGLDNGMMLVKRASMQQVLMWCYFRPVSRLDAKLFKRGNACNKNVVCKQVKKLVWTAMRFQECGEYARCLDAKLFERENALQERCGT